MSRTLRFTFTHGSGAPLELMSGCVYLTPTIQHVNGTSIVMPQPTIVHLVDGLAEMPGVLPSPDGTSPDWAYKVKVVGPNREVYEWLIGIPDLPDPLDFVNATFLSGTEPYPITPPAPARTNGWASYTDTAKTLAVPQLVLQGTSAAIQNNAAVKLDAELPSGVTSLYDPVTNKILPPEAGDSFTGYVRIKASANGMDAWMSFGVDIGGPIGEIFTQTFNFPKGAGVYHDFTFPITGWMSDVFKANGGVPTVRAGSRDISIYHAQIFINVVYRPEP